MELKTLFSSVADAIREKDGSTDPIVAADFPDRIREIPSGSTVSDPLSPTAAYKDTRPSDWLQMPEPADDEMYLLFHIPDGASSLLAFTVTCTEDPYAVGLGTVENGEFKLFQTPYGVQEFYSNSGEKTELELSADEFGDLTSSGFKQVMIRVSGTGILSWVPAVHSLKSAPANFKSWNIVEIACRLPNATTVQCGTTTAVQALGSLRYFSWYGENQLKTGYNMFSYCRNLIAVLQLDTSKVTTMANMFDHCNSLISIPELNTSLVSSMAYMFDDCRSFTVLPQLNTSRVTNFSYMFNYCYSLAVVPLFDTSNAVNMASMFANCYSIREIPAFNTAKVTSFKAAFAYCYNLRIFPELDIGSATDISTMFNSCSTLSVVKTFNPVKVTTPTNAFQNCYSLSSIRVSPDISGWAGVALSFANCSMGHKAIVDLFESLPTITGTAAITITGNPGVSSLTDEEKAIATNKNWTLTL